MQREAAKKLVRDTLERPFDKDQFVKFTKNLLNRMEDAPFTYRGNYIFADFQDYVETLERIGKYEDSDGNKLDVLIVHLKKATSLERARASQRKFVAKYLKGSRGNELKDAALVAFVSPDADDWRFSFVKMDYRIETSDKGRVKVREEFTPARRYSFLVGKHENSHTAQGQLLPILENTEQNPTIQSIEERFSIEKVTKEFFEQYRELYHRLKGALDNLLVKDKDIRANFTEKGVDTVDFAKKLLGQIVFLYFLQKKGWFGLRLKAKWGSGSKVFLRELFDGEHREYRNFFNDILEPLFYDALAREREEDYHPFFNSRIPFLNGGLFDPLNNYDWVNTDILLSNELFSNDEKTKQGDIGTGILDVFDRYNFTVKEDEPLEKEVAVDPEMLGKVFENLLEVKDRKSKGTYYTPREIVHYMCQESLISCLAEKLEEAVSRNDIETLIKHGDTALENDTLVNDRGEERGRYKYKLPDTVRENAGLIDQELAEIKVCDPAVGSGAFLVGMMSEIVRTRMVLSQFVNSDVTRTAYDLKRNAIQSSLYGVDIDLSAVEIAKLRLWLSLIVDEDDFQYIKPLPNLDYKLMQGNSLVEDYDGIKLIDDKLFETHEEESILRNRAVTEQLRLQREYIQLDSRGALTKMKKAEYEKRLKDIERQLKGYGKLPQREQESLGIFGKSESQSKSERLKLLHESYFSAYNKREKDRIRNDIERLTWDLIETTCKQQGELQKLEEVKGFRKTNTKPFFLWKLNYAEVFQAKQGFDVIIANPPYITIGGKQDSGSTAQTIRSLKATYETFQYKTNYFVLFIERAIALCHDRSVISFIVPRSLLDNHHMDRIRSRILEQARLQILIKIEDKVFEEAETGGNLIVVLSPVSTKVSESHSVATSIITSVDQLTEPHLTFIDQTHWAQNPGSKFVVQGLEEDTVIRQILIDCVELGEICNIKNGVNTGNAAKILLADKKGGVSYRKILEGKDVFRFKIAWNGLWINYDPSLKDKIDLKKLDTRQKKIDFALRDESIFLPRKLVVRQTADEIIAALDPDGYITRHSTHVVLTKSTSIDLRCLLVILNSKLINYWYRKQVPEEGKAFAEVKIVNLSKLPIRPMSEIEQHKLTSICEKIIEGAASGNTHALATLRKQADSAVYEIYKLSEKAVDLIEAYWLVHHSREFGR